MVHRSSCDRSLVPAFSAFVALGLAVLATIGATVERPQDLRKAVACEQETACCAAHGTSLAQGGSAEINGEPVPVFCFDQARPPAPEVMDWINSLYDTESDFVLFNSFWGAGNGTPVNLTWSLVPDGTMLPGLQGQASSPSNMFARMNQLFNNNQTLWISLIEQSFDRWSDITGVNFVRVTHGNNPWDDGASFPQSGGSSSRGHFRIGMRPLDGQFGVLAFAYIPTTSDIVFDSSESWGNSGGNYRFFRNTLMHEIGHGLGMAHVCPQVGSKLLEPGLNTGFDGPQHDDMRGLHVRYGDYYSPNSSIGTAVDLGPLEVGQEFKPSVIPGAIANHATRTSIDRAADQDWFRFNISGPVNLNVTVTPVGTSYSSGVQLQGGSCSSGSTVNSLTQAALAVQVFGPNTSSLIATANGNPAGIAESINDLALTQPGNYFVRVFATSASSPQFYRLEISATGGPGTCPSVTQHPSGATLCAGAPFQFSVQATGSPTPTFQWRRNGTPIQGATQSFYHIQSVSASDAGEYDCVVTNTCGSDTSNKAVLNVNTPPTITKHPESQSVPEGSEVSLVAEASGTPAPSFRWYKDNVLISGGTNGTLFFQSVTAADAGTYRAEALTPCGAAPSNDAILTVESACYANCTGSTTPPILTVDDFTCFINNFAAAQTLSVAEQIEHYANCTGSTTPPILTVDDFTCFINAFAQGCP